jgi:hypothetical protein
MLNMLYHLRNSQINSNKNDVMSAQDGVSYCRDYLSMVRRKGVN